MIDPKIIKEAAGFLTKASEKGISSLLAIAFCAYIAWDLRELTKVIVQQGKDIVEIHNEVKQLRNEMNDVWDKYNHGQDEKVVYSERLSTIEEQIRELQRHQ